ncbi:MAG: hypothetical protein JXR94_15785 [Candidatus Hydrogenedentes bacterium]|nr:hypothetical protein [Candidatus Hydrogenedentota bacterium]
MASEERSALLSGEADTDAPAAEEERTVSGDPTQRLLTVLGRFEREMLRGKEGAAQDAWSDAAMRQLIHAVEIAVPQGWQDMVEALTETGRILQTYEDSQRANECLPFLTDSYEILCLMVGDLIVDKVRSGVMRKWRDRYERALEDLAAAGLTLVSDDESGGQQPAQSAYEAPAPPLPSAEPESPFALDAGGFPADDDEVDLPSLDELTMPGPGAEAPAAGAPAAAGPAAAAPEAMEPEAVEPEAMEPEAVEPEAAQAAEDEDGGDDEPIDEALLDLEWPGAAPKQMDAAAQGPVAEPAAPPAQEAARSPLAETLDALCEGLARIEANPEGNLAGTGVSMDQALVSLESHAEDAGRVSAAEACRRMQDMCRQVATERTVAPSDRFFELAYAFCGAYAEACEQQDAAAVDRWLDECSPFLKEMSGAARTPAVEAEEPSQEEAAVAEPVDEAISEPVGAPLAEPEEAAPADEEAAAGVPAEAAPAQGGSPQALLETARTAASQGNAAEAKAFALEAAAYIARAQADDAEARVKQAEARLSEGAAAIEATLEQVRKAEQDVSDAERAAEEARARAEERKAQSTEASERLTQAQEQVGDIEERLRRLQEEREQAVQREADAQAGLASAREEEEAAQAAYDERSELERQARVRLEDARQHVKALQRKRADIESAMERAREALTRQRASVADIERTIQEVRSAETGDGLNPDDLLF